MRRLNTPPTRLLLAGIFTIASCGGSTTSNGPSSSGATSAGGLDGGDDVASTADIAAACTSNCAKDTRCRDASSASCLALCPGNLGAAGPYSRAAFALYVDCNDNPACLSDDVCESRVTARDPSIAAEVTACMAYADSCPSEVSHNSCVVIPFYMAEARKAVKPCYTGTCTGGNAEFNACWRSALQPFTPPVMSAP